MKVFIENAYEDGHESSHYVEVEDPDLDLTDRTSSDVFEWWEDVVFPQTGDGHGAERQALGSYYAATITEADRPEHVGLKKEWA